MTSSLLAALLSPAALAASPPPLPLAGECRSLGDMPGPEDFDLLTLEGEPWLLVGGDDRRVDEASEAAGFYLVGWPSGEQRRLPVRDRDRCSLRPHGVSVYREADGWWAAAVVHFDEADLEVRECALPQGPEGPILHAVERYRVEPDALRFEQRLAAPGFTDPNDVDLGPGGAFVVSNNPPFKVSRFFFQRLFHAGPSEVLAHDPAQGWSVAMGDVLYANGVLLSEAGLLVGTYYGELARVGADPIALEGALDNLLVDEAGVIWVLGHHKPFDFLKHSQDGAHPSPTLTHAVSAEGQVLGSWETPAAAKAASSGLRLLDDQGEPWMVYAQVFEPGLVACPVQDLAGLPALPEPPRPEPAAEEPEAEPPPSAPATQPDEAEQQETEAGE